MSPRPARGSTEGSGRSLPFPNEGQSCALPTLQAPHSSRELTPSFSPCSGNGKLASWTSVLGFVVMMSLDVGLG